LATYTIAHVGTALTARDAVDSRLVDIPQRGPAMVVAGVPWSTECCMSWRCRRPVARTRVGAACAAWAERRTAAAAILGGRSVAHRRYQLEPPPAPALPSDNKSSLSTSSRNLDSARAPFDSTIVRVQQWFPTDGRTSGTRSTFENMVPKSPRLSTQRKKNTGPKAIRNPMMTIRDNSQTLLLNGAG